MGGGLRSMPHGSWPRTQQQEEALRHAFASIDIDGACHIGNVTLLDGWVARQLQLTCTGACAGCVLAISKGCSPLHLDGALYKVQGNETWAGGGLLGGPPRSLADRQCVWRGRKHILVVCACYLSLAGGSPASPGATSVGVEGGRGKCPLQATTGKWVLGSCA
jgi:hypothetical protein